MGAATQGKPNKRVEIELPIPPKTAMERLKLLFKDKELPKHTPYINTGVEG